MDEVKEVCRPVGLKTAKIVFVGEAPGEDEERIGVPFVGSAGQELRRLCRDSGVDLNACYVTNVFMSRPPDNDLSHWYVSRKESEAKCLAANHPFLPPHKAPGKYLDPDIAIPALNRLSDELASLAPNIVIALGNTACWALLGTSGIMALRGTINKPLMGTAKVLPTYHPAAILRQWDLRPVTILDLRKALRESAFPEIRIPRREIWIKPNLADLHLFFDLHLSSAKLISFDIETEGRQITCIGFAPTPSTVICVPFQDKDQPGYHYWKSQEEEVEAWRWVRRVLESPVPKLGQNAKYDCEYLIRVAKIAVNLGANGGEDCMLLHHSIQPELQKSLGFMGSVYTNSPSWKGMYKDSQRVKAKDE